MRFLSLNRVTLARLHFCDKLLNSGTYRAVNARKKCPRLCLYRYIASSKKEEDIGRIRNIGIVAHVDAGKTTTTERVLYYSGFSEHLGDVDDGDTVMDYMEQEKERGITITSAAITFNWNKYKINLIDTPGHIDFTVEVERSLRVLDGSITVLDASAGVEAQTLTVWKQADKYKIPSLIYLNKMDKPAASVDHCLSSLKDKLNIHSALINFPFNCDRNLMETLDVIGFQKLTWNLQKCPDGSQIEREVLKEEVDKELWDMAVHWRSILIEQLADHDETIANHVLSDTAVEDIPVVDIRKALRHCTINRTLVPVLCGSSLRNMGLQPLMDAVCLYLPSPRERHYDFIQYYVDSLCALAFKTIHHRQRGVLTFLRIYSGRIRSGAEVYNVNHHYVEKVNRLLQVFADDFKDISEAGPGNIVCISGLKQTVTGDTITSSQKAASKARKKMHAVQQVSLKSNQMRQSEILEEEDVAVEDPVLAGMEVPPPVFFCSIEPPSLSAQRQMERALECLQREDPSFKVKYNADTGQTILQGMGELHMEIIKQRILEEYSVEVYLGPLQVAYRETLQKGSSVTADECLDRSIGGKKHNVSMELVLEYNAEARKLKKIRVCSENDEEPIVIRPQQRKHIEFGVRNALTVGPILSYPVINVDVLLTKLFIKSGTSPAIISACASQCVHKALKNASSDLLEPMMKLQHLQSWKSEQTQRNKVTSTTVLSRDAHTLMVKDGINSLLKPSSQLMCTKRFAHNRQKITEKIDGLPAPLTSPTVSPLPQSDYSMIYFDLETTDLRLTADIIELAAVCEDNSFRRYIHPSQPINPETSKVTGLYYIDRILYHQEEKLDAVSIVTALLEFGKWLNNYKSPVLIAHNAKNFDSMRLARTLCQNPDIALNKEIVGYIDTLHVFRDNLPRQNSYAQGILAKNAEINVENAHCALDDAKVLQKLVSHHKVTDKQLLKHSFSLQYSLDLYHYKLHKSIKSYDVLINLDVVGYSVAKRLCQAGVSVDHLKQVYDFFGERRFFTACLEMFPKVYKVTLNECDIAKLASYFSKQHGRK